MTTHQLAWSQDYSPAGLVSGLLTSWPSLTITHQSEDYLPAGLVWGLLTSQLGPRITHQSDDYSPAGLVWQLLTSRSVSGGRHVQCPGLKVLWQWLQGDEGVQRPVGPQVHAEVAHMASCQEVIRWRHTQRSHSRVHSEAVNKPAHSDKRTAWLKAKPLHNPEDAQPDLAVYSEAVDQTDTEEHVQQCFASWTSMSCTVTSNAVVHLVQLLCPTCTWSIQVLPYNDVLHTVHQVQVLQQSVHPGHHVAHFSVYNSTSCTSRITVHPVYHYHDETSIL